MKAFRRQLGTKADRKSAPAPAAPAGLGEEHDVPIQVVVREREWWISPATESLYMAYMRIKADRAAPATVEAAEEASEPLSVYASDAASAPPHKSARKD